MSQSKSERDEILRKRVKSGIYFKEPIGPERKFRSNSADIDKIRFGQTRYHQMARNKLNSWLKDWDFDDLNDIVRRLESKSKSQHEGAVWELYLNSMFRNMGYKVGRDPLFTSGKTPDFLIKKGCTRFYVEATCISNELKTRKERNWIDLVSQIETIERDDFCIDLYPIEMSDEVPKSSSFKREIIAFLDQFDYEEAANWNLESSPKKLISIGAWKISVTVSRRNPRGNSEIFIRIRTNGGIALITDLEDLKRKIGTKRKRYGVLKHPLLIAILENSFVGGDRDWHRFGALFGQEAVVISGDESTELIRKPNGIWDLNRGETNVDSLLLLNKLDLWNENLGLPELWTNPNLPGTWFQRRLPFLHWRVDGDNYRKYGDPKVWNGFEKLTFFHRWRMSLLNHMHRVKNEVFTRSPRAN